MNYKEGSLALPLISKSTSYDEYSQSPYLFSNDLQANPRKNQIICFEKSRLQIICLLPQTVIEKSNNWECNFCKSLVTMPQSSLIEKVFIHDGNSFSLLDYFFYLRQSYKKPFWIFDILITQKCVFRWIATLRIVLKHSSDWNLFAVRSAVTMFYANHVLWHITFLNQSNRATVRGNSQKHKGLHRLILCVANSREQLASRPWESTPLLNCSGSF